MLYKEFKKIWFGREGLRSWFACAKYLHYIYICFLFSNRNLVIVFLSIQIVTVYQLKEPVCWDHRIMFSFRTNYQDFELKILKLLLCCARWSMCLQDQEVYAWATLSIYNSQVFSEQQPWWLKQPKKSEKTFLYAKCKNIGKFSNLKVKMKTKFSQPFLKPECHMQALCHIHAKIKFHSEFYLVCTLVFLENISVLIHRSVVSGDLLISFWRTLRKQQRFWQRLNWRIQKWWINFIRSKQSPSASTCDNVIEENR